MMRLAQPSFGRPLPPGITARPISAQSLHVLRALAADRSGQSLLQSLTQVSAEGPIPAAAAGGTAAPASPYSLQARQAAWAAGSSVGPGAAWNPRVPSAEQKQLDQRVWHASSVDDLLEIISACSADFSPATAANSLTKLAKLLRGTAPAMRQAARRHAALPQLLACVERHTLAFRPRDVCAVLLACAWLQLAAPGSMIEGLAQQLAQQVPTAQPRDVTQSLWALAKLGFASPTLLAAVEAHALAGTAPQHSSSSSSRSSHEEGGGEEQAWLGRLPAASLTVLLWACAKLGYHSEPLLQAVAAALTANGKAALLGAGELATVIYSCGTLGWHPGPVLLGQLTSLLRPQLPRLLPQGLANAAWGLAKLGHRDDAFMSALAQEAASRAADFSMPELAVLLTAYSGLGLRELGLLAAVSQQLESRALECSPRDLADLLSSLATLGYRPSSVALAAATKRGAQLVPRLPPVYLTWLVWGFARLGHTPRPLLASLENVCKADGLRLHQFAPADLARLCWSLAKLRHYSGRLLDTLEAAFRDALPCMPPQSLAMSLHAFASLGYTPHQALDAAAEHLACRLQEYPPQAAAMAAWSFAKLGVHPGRGLPGGGPTTPDGLTLIPALTALAEQRVDEFSVQGLAMLLWAFATLEDLPPRSLLEAVSQRVRAELSSQAALLLPQERQAGLPPVSLQAATNIAWSFARLAQPDEQLFAAIGAAVPGLVQQAVAAQQAEVTVSLGEERAEGVPQSLANLVYAAAKLGIRDAQLLQAVEAAAAPRLAAFHPDELSNLLWAYAHLDCPLPSEFLGAACTRLEASLRDCSPSLCCLAVHALACMRYRAPSRLLAACVAHVAAAVDEVPPSLGCKLLWGCATVGYMPREAPLQTICTQLYYQLSHARARATVLPAGDSVLLAWALAVLGQYNTALYRSIAFRTSRFPDAVPAQQAHVSMLQQVALLSNVDGAPAADTVLPDWLQLAGSAAARAVPEQWAAAEALRDALLAAGQAGAAVKRLAYGECVVLLPLGRGQQAALLPWWEGSRAVNAADQAVGSTLVAQRALSATGLRVLAAGSDMQATVAACTALA